MYFDGSATLEASIKRQFSHFAALKGESAIAGLPGLLSYLDSDPRITSILDDFIAVATQHYLVFIRQVDRTAEALLAIWTELSPESRKLANQFEDLDGFEQLVRPAPQVADVSWFTDSLDVPRFDPSGLGSRAQSLHAGLKRAAQTSDRKNPALSPLLRDAGSRVLQVAREHEAAWRLFFVHEFNSAGRAYERLRALAHFFVPPASLTEEQRSRRSAIFAFRDELRLPDTIFDGWSTHTGSEYVKACEALAERMRRWAENLRLGLLLQVDRGRSNITLLRRFAARVEQFDADELRAASDRAPRRAEEILRKELARYLYDQGLNPLMDPSIAGVRPDLLHVPVYVEAKQYHEDTKSLSREIRTYVSQVCNTWETLRKRLTEKDIDEAFLAIFRRSGPDLILPECLPIAPGRRLFLVVVNLAPRDQSGSRQKRSPVHLGVDDLLPLLSRTGVWRPRNRGE